MSEKNEAKNQYFYCSKSNQIRPLRVALDLQHHALLDHASMFSCPLEYNEGAFDFTPDKKPDFHSEQDEESIIKDETLQEIITDVIESGVNQLECITGEMVSDPISSCPTDFVSNVGTKRKAQEHIEFPSRNMKRLAMNNVNTTFLPIVNQLGTIFTKWDRHEVKALITAYEKTISIPYTNRELWKNVADELIKNLGFTGRIDREMCSRKWNTLLRAYQTAKARNCPSYTEWYYDMKRVVENPLRVLNKKPSKQASKSVLRKLQEEIIECGSQEIEFLDDESNDFVPNELTKTSRKFLKFKNKANKKWSYFEVKALIASFGSHYTKQREKNLFENIAGDLQKYNYDVNASMVRRKWKLLIQSYEAAKYKRANGFVSHFEFYDDMAEILENSLEPADSNKSENNGENVALVGMTSEINSPLFSWGNSATKELIKCYKCHMLMKPNCSRPSWQEIAKELSKTFNHPVTRITCRNKWQKLKMTYLKYLETDHPQDFEFFDDMNSAVGNEITYYLEESSLPENEKGEEVETAMLDIGTCSRIDDNEPYNETRQTYFNEKKLVSKKQNLEEEKLRIQKMKYKLMLKYLDLKEKQCTSPPKQIIIVKSSKAGENFGRIIQARTLFDNSLQ